MKNTLFLLLGVASFGAALGSFCTESHKERIKKAFKSGNVNFNDYPDACHRELAAGIVESECGQSISVSSVPAPCAVENDVTGFYSIYAAAAAAAKGLPCERLLKAIAQHGKQ